MDRTLFASEEDSQVPHIWGTPDAVEIVTKFISLICISILSVLFGIKIYKIELRYLTYSKWLVLALYVCSWAFSMTATLLASTNDGKSNISECFSCDLSFLGNETSCTLSQLTCDLFYSGSKFIIYVWLIEKVWIVSGNSVGRWKSPTYIFHMCLLIPYIGIMAIMIYFKISGLDPAGVCTIGLSLIASIPLLIFDFLLSSFMSILFIKPLFIAGKNAHDDWRNSRLHGVAVRSFVASIVGLLVSFVNILVLILFPQGVRDILCFTCCTIDVTINVITIHWVRIIF
ncbi:hypothetical protein CLU79DRAFT_694327 [Phycomyces nitens]|nr:hypothetical protein CLU79DRAFT_694327 [Phycomyces nitens]